MAYDIHVIDKQTAAEFSLRVEGTSPQACFERLFSLGFVVGPCRIAPEPTPDPAYQESEQLLTGLGYVDDPLSFPRGRVHEVTGEGGLSEFVEMASQSVECHPTDRHYLLQCLVRLAYTVGNPKGKSAAKAASQVSPEAAWKLIEPFAWQWIVESPTFRRYLRSDLSAPLTADNFVGITVFDDLRKHLAARGFQERAAELARIELAFYGC